MEYKKIKPRKIYEQVAEELLLNIKNGDLKPGDKLDSVWQLAENFQVGRSAIREALSALRAMGLIEMRQGEGTFVREFDPSMISLPITTAVLMKKEDIENLLEVRKVLEVGASGAAASKRTEEDLTNMKNILEKMLNSVGDEELGEKVDFQFHLAVAKASQNPLLVGLMNNVGEMMLQSMRETRRVWLYSKETTSQRLYDEHMQIYKAIEAMDVRRAQDLMISHLMSVEAVLLENVVEEK
ncbi:FadR/GntR family transcriptional regulator [Priestia filamentosa]|uniref:GntR family transcriptional regulator n=1 Tax=Priestia filamentosa TaxID=1402861 RepID=A0A1X7EZU8_9BACI|nr:FadR/GntR family transcriptional regulator [Priestia filamentosa]AKO91468.1 GntR family transcriptional regulator [Priestia filamentosa]MDT3761560.1 FadR/GntR family transcriptional regulator [Priestia filamentosa]OXS67662.1 GntR family transcriptional regulator [Priestia filamentosa]RJS65133.1 FadR family transcriptional regulator [Priestia filamentosa]WCM16665.1 FadR/GntR family transcriptional regulator [Priestia filamentosa]